MVEALRKLINNSFTRTVATILAPATGGISVAALALARKFTGKHDENDVADTLMTMPKERTDEFKLQMEELANRELDMLLKDRQGARSMAIAMKDSAQGWTQPILAGTSVFGFFYVVYILMTDLSVPDDSRDLLFMLLGILAATYKDVHSFYFGSSKGSKDKTIALYGRR